MNRQSIIYLTLYIALLISLSTSIPSLPQGIHSMHLGDFQQFTPNKSEQIMAYYDFNYDEYCDVLTVVTYFSPQDKTVKTKFLTLYLWNEKEQFFVKSIEMNLSMLNVVSVIPTQFYNRNEPETDLVLTYHYVPEDSDAQAGGKKFAVELMKVYCNKDENVCEFRKSFSTINELKMFDSVLPTIVVLQGRPSLLFRKNNQAYVFYFILQQTGEYKYQVFSLLKSGKYLNVQKTNTDISPTLAYQLSYFGDYNGDGIADLVVSQKFTTETTPYNKIHFFKYDKNVQKFTFEKTFDLKSVEQSLSTWLQFFTLQDINFDGRIDFVVLFKSGLIQVHYNKIPNSQVKLIEENGFEMFPFDFYDTVENYVAKIQRIKLPTFTPISTSGLLFGDFNRDGYDDLIIDCQYNVPSGQLDENNQPIMKTAQKSLLLINTPCTIATDCGDSTFNSRFLLTLDLFTIRKFSILQTLPITYKTNDSFKMFFIDLYKDGKLDLISHRLSSTTSFYTWDRQPMRSKSIEIYFNTVYYDAFFMKVRVMKGTNYDEIHGNLVMPGGNVNCFVTSLGGEMLPKVGNQYPQLGRVMHLPYVFFGLGRTNNYVNELTITIPYISLQQKYQNMWTPIIPNSQILTLAHPEGKWQLSAFIEPTHKMGLVAFLVVLSLIVLGVVICRLTIQEKNEDKENLENFYSIL